MIAVILFDFFGVLSTSAHVPVIQKNIRAYDQGTWMKRLDVLDAGTISEDDFVGEIAQSANKTKDQVWSDVLAAPQLQTEVWDFIATNLKPHFRVGLLKNAPRSLIERVVGERLQFFDPLLISSDLGVVKPDRKIFEIAVERSEHLPEEILFIDDNEKNIIAAQGIGMHGLVYKDFTSFREEIQKYIS